MFLTDGTVNEMAAEMAVLGAALEMLMVMLAAALVISAVFYVLQSVGLYTIAKRRKLEKPWLAWLPMGNMWILGSIADHYQYKKQRYVRSRARTLLGLMIAMFLLSLLVEIYAAQLLDLILEADPHKQSSMYYNMIPDFIVVIAYLALLVVSVIGAVMQYVALYDLYRSCDPDNATTFLVLSIIFSVVMPVFLFACRNKDLGLPPEKTPERMQ